MDRILLITHVVISVLLVMVIMMQNKDAGLSAVMGGGEGFKATKRGPEKILFRITVVLGILFLLNGLLFVLV